MFNKIIVLCLSIGLFACGGGGGGGGESNASGGSNVSTAPSTIGIHDLVAAPNFDFDPTSMANVKVDIGSTGSSRAYVSIYSEYLLTGNGEVQPDYDSRIHAGNMLVGRYESEIHLPPDVDTVLAEIWFYDGSTPLQKMLVISNGDFVW